MTGNHRDLSRKQERLVFRVRATTAPRLDRYLGEALRWRSRARIQDLIQSGRVRVNGEACKPARKVRPGDEVVLDLTNRGSPVPDYGRLELDVLYEDPWLVAVNKPPGILVHPVGSHVYDTLINYMHHRYRECQDEDGKPVRPRLCHRIDRETTGVLVVAKDTYVHNELRAQFENRQVRKEYAALVAGSFHREGDVDIPIGEGRDLASSLRHETLKISRTGIRVEQRLREHTLLSCVPATGRQNQIRIHLAAIGFPIVGDRRYGAPAPPGDYPQRYLLHSRSLQFRHPRLKCGVELAAPFPEDFRQLLERL